MSIFVTGKVVSDQYGVLGDIQNLFTGISKKTAIMAVRLHGHCSVYAKDAALRVCTGKYNTRQGHSLDIDPCFLHVFIVRASGRNSDVYYGHASTQA